ncbi:DegV family protein [Helicovermis profundi]|uniref:DegV family protein n=1 Tax=Helicovermis profundi TaxID=3065157 RepID=A0AAU9EXV0_9FIRM|nr:DegV family protein [Clostridia bacterium S502]
MKIKIITDSNCDLSEKYIKDNDIPVVPFYFNLNGKHYEDNFGKELGYKEFYNELNNGVLSTTSQITPYNFEELFRKLTSEGYKLIYIGFSSALSETFNNAKLAKDSLVNENKDTDITLIDSLNATSGQGLLVYYAVKMLKGGKSKEQIINWVENNKNNVNTWFTVNSLMHLKRGGRISLTSATIGGILDVKPILMIDRNGKLVSIKKTRGRKKSIRALMDEFKEKVLDPENQVIFINHADCLEDAEFLKSMVLEEYNVKDVVINYLGPVIGSHGGPGLLSISFLGEDV